MAEHSGPDGEAAEFTLRNDRGKRATVLRGDRPVARYEYDYDPAGEGRHETAKPYLHVLDPTTGEPITKGPGGKYTHHRGVFVGWNQLGVGDETWDFWHMDDSDIVHREFDGIDRFAETRTLTSEARWITGAGETVLTERREQTFRQPPTRDGIVVVDFASTLAPTDSAVDLAGDPEHAGVQYRAHDAVAENESAAYVFPADVFDDPEPSDEAVGAAAGLRWVAMTYRLGDDEYLVQQLNHPDNPPETTFSAYRPYGRFGAFFEANLAADKSLTVRYRFLIRATGDYSREELDARYAEYVD